MNQATEPTARPWKFAFTGLKMQLYGQGVAIADASCLNLVCGLFSDVKGGDETAKANAKLICQAVNSYEALLAVAKAAQAVADHASQSIKDLQRYGERSDYNIAKPAIERLKSALSQLETTKH